MLSFTPEPDPVRYLQIESISSNIITWSSSSLYYDSVNNDLKFSSDYPTILLIISGPFTILIFYLFVKLAAICLAINVLPQPGGPYKRRPFVCLIPYYSMISFDNFLEKNILLNISISYY